MDRIQYAVAFREMMAVFLPNRANFSLDELDRYQDRYIAFNPEGTKIIVSTERLEEMSELTRAAGFDPAFCVVEYVS